MAPGSETPDSIGPGLGELHEARRVVQRRDAGMEFAHVGADRRRAHAEEHPVDRVGQVPDHFGNQSQVALMAGGRRL